MMMEDQLNWYLRDIRLVVKSRGNLFTIFKYKFCTWPVSAVYFYFSHSNKSFRVNLIVLYQSQNEDTKLIILAQCPQTYLL